MNPVRFRVETDRSISSVCFFPGGHGGVATPVSIPNTEVKGSSGEGTAGIARGRVARCQDFFSGEDVIGYPPLFLLCRVSARGGGEPPRAMGSPQGRWRGLPRQDDGAVCHRVRILRV